MARIATRQHGVISRAQVFALGFGPDVRPPGPAQGPLPPTPPRRLRRRPPPPHPTRPLARGRPGLWRDRRPQPPQRGCPLASRLPGAGKGGRPRPRPRLPLPPRDRNPPHPRPPAVRHHRDRRHPGDHPQPHPPRPGLDHHGIQPPQRRSGGGPPATPRPPFPHRPLRQPPGPPGNGRPAHASPQEQRGPISATRSPDERLFLRLCLARGLPTPAVNVPLAGYEADFFWRPASLVVEIDSYGYHRSWAEQESDRAKDAALQVAGFNVLRYTEETLLTDEDRVFSQIGTFLDL